MTRLVGSVFFVRWLDPQVTDLPLVNAALEKAIEHEGGPIIYVAIIPGECEPPDDKTRAGFIGTMRDVLSRCETMHLVMEGSGFKNAILRSAVTTVLLVPGQRETVFVESSLEDALTNANERASKRTKFVVSQVLREAQAAGVASRSSRLTAT